MNKTKQYKPRTAIFMGQPIIPNYLGDTWIEGEMINTDYGQFRRRGLVRHSVTNELVKVKLDIPFNLYYLAIVIVIFLQICGSLTIIYSSLTKKYKKEAYYFIIGLVIFTILATILYYMPPFGPNYHTFLNHLAVIGGLLLLSDKFK